MNTSNCRAPNVLLGVWSADTHGRLYLEELRSTESYMETISFDTSKTIDILSSLSQAFKVVDTQTTAFQTQCEDLIVEQRRLETLADNIGENLQYYSFLEPITRKLNAPGAGNFVRGKEFSDMLARLDECLEYMGGHVSLTFHSPTSYADLSRCPKKKPPPTDPDTGYYSLEG